MSILDGAVDTHVHTAPDLVERHGPDPDIARAARDAGMRAVVVKNHVVPTVGRVDAVNAALGERVLLGGVVLNGAVGGLNPDAAEAALELGATVVWLPTLWSQPHASEAREEGADYVKGQRVPDPGETVVVVEDGTVVPRARRIVELVAAHDAVLATGHVGLEAALAVADLCERQGARCLVNHPFSRHLGASVGDHERLADRGAILEYCALSVGKAEGHDAANLAGTIDRVGPEHCLLATDYGQVGNPPVGGFEAFAASLVDAGLDRNTVRRLVTEAPARLLGLD